jgi:hypothetical protein
MKESQLKNAIGIFIILSYFLVILLTLVVWLLGGLLFEEMTTTIALIIPMFSLYLTAILKYIIANKMPQTMREKRLSKVYIFISFLIPILFLIVLITIILMKSFNVGFSDFEQFKIMLGVIQTAFGAYMGLILSSLFEIEGSQKSNNKPQSPNFK